MSDNKDIKPPHANHPGWTADGCPARITINASPYGTSSNGFACAVTGEHCVPGSYCDNRRKEWAEFNRRF